MDTSSLSQNKSPNDHLGKTKTIILSVLFAIVGIVVLIMVFSHGISDTARAQLAAIKSGNIQQAYDMTSSAFQEETSLQQFTKFIKKYPILTDNVEIAFKDRKIDGDMGYLAGTLHQENGDTKTIEFQLLKEKGEWKIQGMQLSDKIIAPKQNGTDTAVVHAVLISDSADADGFVTKEKAAIPQAARKIYATIQILSSSPGSAISATLVYLPSGKKMGPEIDKTTKTGNIMKAFSFKREGKTWPKGNYEVRVELSSGNGKVIQFKVV